MIPECSRADPPGRTSWPVAWRESLARYLLAVLVAVGVTSCGSARTGLLTANDLPSSLRVSLDAGAASSLPGGSHHPTKLPDCGDVIQVVFSSPGRAALNLTGDGIPELRVAVVSSSFPCASEQAAQRVLRSYQHVLTAERIGWTALTGIGVKAQFEDQSDSMSFPASRSYSVLWRNGRTVGEIGLVGPDRDPRITPQLAKLLAGRVAQGG